FGSRREQCGAAGLAAQNARAVWIATGEHHSLIRVLPHASIMVDYHDAIFLYLDMCPSELGLPAVMVGRLRLEGIVAKRLPVAIGRADEPMPGSKSNASCQPSWAMPMMRVSFLDHRDHLLTPRCVYNAKFT